MSNEVSEANMRALESNGLHMRALAILGDDAERASYEQYADALAQASRERAGQKYATEIVEKAGLSVARSNPDNGSEGLHRAAVSYLKATGKSEDYSAEDYLEAVAVVQRAVSGERA
jgi:hypothetical protein